VALEHKEWFGVGGSRGRASEVEDTKASIYRARGEQKASSSRFASVSVCATEMECKRTDDTAMSFEHVCDESTVYIPNLDYSVGRTGSEIMRGGVDGDDVHRGVMGFGNDAYRMKRFGKGGRKGGRK